MRPVLLAFVSGVVLAFAGCGDDDGGDSASDPSPSRQTTTPPPARGAEGEQANVHKGTPLKKEIYPRCGVTAYGSPSVAPVPQFGGFQLIYTHEDAENPVVRKGKTTRFSVEERPKDSTPVKYEKGRVARIEGQMVDLVDVEGGFTAQWITDRARYVVIGGPVDDGVVRRLVHCLP